MITIISSILTYYILVTIGITFGYHRYFSHNEFKACKWYEYIMLTCGAICGGGSPLVWCVTHRMHHVHADTPKDPYGTGWKALLSLWKVKRLPYKYAKDLKANPRVMWFHKYRYYVAAFFFILFPYQVGFTFIMSWIGFGVLNRFGHKDGKPVNRWWINIIGPWEGNHDDHHKDSTRNSRRSKG